MCKQIAPKTQKHLKSSKVNKQLKPVKLVNKQLTPNVNKKICKQTVTTFDSCKQTAKKASKKVNKYMVQF